MTDQRSIRFGLQVNPAVGQVVEVAHQAELAGFDVVSVADHVGDRMPAPIPLMAQLLAATERIMVGSLVINNDMRNPVQLAWEIAWLHRTSGGRVELGLGAGHTPHEYAATGIALDHPKKRKARLAESIEILAALFRGESVTRQGGHYQIEDAKIVETATPIPLLVGGSGAALLSHAARHVDTIGLMGLGKTLADGHRHAVKFGAEHLEHQLAIVAAAAAERKDGVVPELNALVQVAEITDDRERELAAVLERTEGLTMEDASSTPYLAVGTVDELARHFIACRDRWGITYFTVRTAEWAAVIQRVRELEPTATASRLPGSTQLRWE